MDLRTLQVFELGFETNMPGLLKAPTIKAKEGGGFEGKEKGKGFTKASAAGASRGGEP